MMLISTPLSAQLSNPPLIIANHPLGACPNGQLALDIIDNTNWICNGGWVQLASGAGGSITLNQVLNPTAPATFSLTSNASSLSMISLSTDYNAVGNTVGTYTPITSNCTNSS